MKYELHPACAAWPAMEPEKFRELVEDIKANGLHEPITLTPDKLLLDGRNRNDACDELGIEAATVIYDGDPVTYSISKNHHRRHLSPTDLAFVGVELAKLTRGGTGANQHTKKGANPSEKIIAEGADAVFTASAQSQTDIAESLGITRTNLQNAKTINDKGTKEIIDLAKTGKIGLRAAADYVRATPKGKQQADPKVIREAVGKSQGGGGASAKPKSNQETKPTPQPDSDKTDNEKVGKRAGGPQLARAREIVRPILEAGKSVSPQKLEEEHGISHVTFDMAITAELGYREGYQAGFDAALTPEALGPKFKERYERLVKRQEKEFKSRVDEQVQEFVRSTMWQNVRERLRLADAVINRTPPLTREEFRKMLMALHTDTSNSELLNEALIILNKKRDILRPARDKSEGLLAGLQEQLDQTLGTRPTRH